MTALLEAAKQALEALETVRPQNMAPEIHPAKVALRAAIEQAEQVEPVAWCEMSLDGKRIAYFDGKPIIMEGRVGNACHPTPLYQGETK